MAEEHTFSLITVDTEEEDDLIIQAGAVGAPQTQTAGAAGAAGEVEAAAEAYTEDEAGVEVEASAVEAPQVQRSKPKDVNAMITTEEDLRAKGPFVGMQRTILVVFVLLLVACIAYWVFLR